MSSMDHHCRQKISMRDNEDLSRSLNMTINRVQLNAATALKSQSFIISDLSKTLVEAKVIGTDKSQEFEIESNDRTIRPNPQSRVD